MPTCGCDETPYRTAACFVAGLFGGLAPPVAGGFSLGTREGVFQMGTDVQMGAGPAKIKVGA